MKRIAVISLCLSLMPFFGTAQIITTIAGTGSAVMPPVNGISALLADQFYPIGLAVNSAGDIFVANRSANCVRKIDPSGIVTNYAGNTTATYTGDGGPATDAGIHLPTSLALDAAGNLYITEVGSSVVRKVTTSGYISTVAGNGTYGYSGDGGPATSAEIRDVSTIALDASGNLYIGDFANFVIRKVTPAGIISTYAGTGSVGSTGDGGPATAATLHWPRIAIDPWNNIYIANNSTIRKIDAVTGIITHVYGSGVSGYSVDGTPATAANFSTLWFMLFDTDGTLYLADNGYLRKISTAGVLTTVAGCGTGTPGPAPGGYSGDNGPADCAMMFGVGAFAFDANHDIILCDQANNRVRKISTPELCLGATQTLAAGIAGGTWSSTNPAVATVNMTSGLVTTVAAGTAIISFYGGYDSGHTVINVHPMPAAIAGDTTICVGSANTLTNAVPGGTWSVSDVTKATINASTGVATGVGAGTALVTYTFGASCQTMRTIVVNNCPTSVNGNATQIAYGLKIYPSPATGSASVEFPPSYGAESILTITDIAGKMVVRKAIPGNQTVEIINTAAMQPGVYLVNVLSRVSRYIGKLVIAK